MSTISIVDWINSLSDSELEDQLVLAVDGSTPTKGNSGNKASLSGGSDADFDAMPQVDGDPIVERGSNNDGEWVRFSNGFQICFQEYSVNLSTTVVQTNNMPNDFDYDFPVSVTHGFNKGDTDTDDQNAKRNSYIEHRKDDKWIMRSSGSGQDTSSLLGVSAIGRWK